MYECLACPSACLNDAPGPPIGDARKAVRVPQDAASLACSCAGHGRARVASAWAAFRGLDCWETAFLLEASTAAQRGAAAQQPLGYRADVCGVLSGLLP